MKLKEILKGIKLKQTENFSNIEIRNIAFNSNEIGDANLFVCIKGEKFDSHNEMSKLQDLIDVFIVDEINPKILKTQIKVSSTRKILLKILLNFNLLTKTKIKIVGITGTNGKTTTSYYAKYLLEKLGFKVAVLGTSGCVINNDFYPTNLTTPIPEQMVMLLKEMNKRGIEILIMEVSAHSVLQHRIEGLKFEIGCFTNLTHDHLDDFSSLFEYAYYKFLFIKKAKKRIINIEDKFGAEFSIHNKAFTVGFKKAKLNFSYNIDNGTLSLIYDGKNYEVKTNISTSYNYFNLVFAICISLEIGCEISSIILHCNNMPNVSGRYNLFKMGNKRICIDYAHSPDAIEKVLSNLKRLSRDIIVVFGASGFRDSIKRIEMGKVASKFASHIILTADNPRYENINQINEQISNGIKIPYVNIPNREDAIKYAFRIAKENSIIAILGKGNETSQDLKAKDVPYNDYEVCKAIADLDNDGELNE